MGAKRPNSLILQKKTTHNSRVCNELNKYKEYVIVYRWIIFNFLLIKDLLSGKKHRFPLMHFLSYYNLFEMVKFQVSNGSSIDLRYRVSHETWQLVNSFECLLPHTVLDIKDFLQLILKKMFNSYIFYCEINFTII